MNQKTDLYRFCDYKFFKMVVTKLAFQHDASQKQDGGQLDPNTCFRHIFRTVKQIFTVFASQNSLN